MPRSGVGCYGVMSAPSGTVTFLFTDIEGSTRLWQVDESAIRAALSRHDELLRKAIADHDGVVFSSMGDGMAAAFSSASAAVAAAVTAQRLLEAETWAAAAPIRVRMGIHTGEAVARDGDYFGTAVNRTARLMAIGHGGQVLCSQATAVVVGAGVPDGAVLVDLGERRLRDLSEPIRVFQVRHRDLRAEFPPLRSVDAVATNLPTVRTELIGRSEDVAALADLVEREPLVSLVGVGGVGKTRLALAVAAALASGFADGCWLVELAAVAEGSEVARTVAAAIGAPMSDLQGLVGYLADRRMLVVLDNCEHVLPDAADLLDALLAACPEVHVVVTSREPIGLDGEQVRRVQSLGVPAVDAAAGEAAQAAAVRLFAARAAAVSDHFEIGDANVAAVSDMPESRRDPAGHRARRCRVRAMPPPEIAGRLEERFRLLAGGSRRAQERHRTLLAAVSWSHDLLREDEKIVFRRLCVFPSTFDLAAAEAVAGDVGLDVVDCVVRLVDRSLVQYEPGEGRYRLLETLRQYGKDRLADAGETDETTEHHARFYLGLVERIGPELLDARYRIAHAQLSLELDNLRATAAWCSEHDRWVELAAMAQQSWLAWTTSEGALLSQKQYGSQLRCLLIFEATGSEWLTEGRNGTMPYVSSGDVRIHYRVEGNGPPLLILPGFSDSVETWYEYGYVKSLAGDYRLILVDPRGHGASDKPHNPDAYSSTNMGVDLVNVLDACQVEQAHVYGYSMGGGMAMQMAKLHPERLRSMITGGASPVQAAEPTELIDQLGAIGDQPEALVKVWESQSAISPELRNRLLANDMGALNANWACEDWAEIDDVLTTFGRPFLLIMGENDEMYPPLKEYSKQLPEEALVSLPGLNHLQAFQRSDLVIPIIADFLEKQKHH